MDLREAGLISGNLTEHWYYRAKAAAIDVALGTMRPSAIMDVGAGSGFFSRQLLRRDHVGSATCIDPGYGRDHDETSNGKPLLFRRHVDQSSADLVLLMDVLEHVENDGALLRSYVQQADRGTRFIITVPAFSWLWSGHDVFLGHHRRYTLGEIRRIVEASGLVVTQSCYLFGALFPLAAASRLLSRLKARIFGPGTPHSQMFRPNQLANQALWWTCHAELRVFRYNKMFGLTAMIVATKPP